MKKILITGATGLIGKPLTFKLLEKGYSINILSRRQQQSQNDNIRYYVWDVANSTIDEEAVSGISAIIHLAGAGIADKRWTKDRKKIIIDSRVKSVELLRKALHKCGMRIDTFISASGINYYGAKTTDHVYIETDPPGDDFTARCCIVWEKAADEFSDMARVVKLRTGVVLSADGGALKRIATPVKFGIGAPIGTGEQYVPFIHINDICDLYIEALENNRYSGAYNAISSSHATNTELTQAIAKAMSKPLFLPNIPAFVIKMVFGELSGIVLEGSRASAQRLLDSGFVFKYPELDEAVNQIYHN